ncbi:hypothetical protein LTR94_026869 [Friedmanniomyces endolithicus]|nr:hypothetical protein LTR94_026869 [Friedmanniomyces endolithicus]
MPDMDGYDFVSWLRREAPEPARFTPVIMILGHAAGARVAKGRDCGASFVVAKPITPAVLLKRILWLGGETRQFVDAEHYVGPDRRVRNYGPPAGGDGRRETDLSGEVGEALEANMDQAAIDELMKPMKSKMARQGGLTVKEALKRAEEGLALQRAGALLTLSEQVDVLVAHCLSAEAQRQAHVYPLASAMVNTAGYLDVPAFYDAAYSLCDAAERMSEAKTWSWPCVEVHARALGLTLSQGGARTPETRRLLEGLKAVVDRISKPG